MTVSALFPSGQSSDETAQILGVDRFYQMPVESAHFGATAILFLPPSGDRYHQHLLGPGFLADAAAGYD